jgi:hypothetical protein
MAAAPAAAAAAAVAGAAPRTPGALVLYRNLMRYGRRYPSKNRESLMEEIRSEFRAHRTLTDPAAVEHELARARQGLATIKMYVDVSRRDVMRMMIR